VTFQKLFHPSPGTIDVDPGSEVSMETFAKAVQKLFLPGQEDQLPPLAVDNDLIEKCHAVLPASADEDVVRTMLTALSCWGNEGTPEVLEQSLLANPPGGSEADAVLRYYILAAAHSPELTEGLESRFLKILKLPDEYWNNRNVICYLTRQHPNAALLQALKEIKGNRRPDYQWDWKYCQLFHSCVLSLEEDEIPALFGPEDFACEEFWGAYLQAAQLKPERAALIKELCRPHTEGKSDRPTGRGEERALVCRELERIAGSYSFIRSLEAMGPQEREILFRKRGNHRTWKSLWELLYPEDRALPSLSELKLLRMLEELDPRLFSEALAALGSLAAPVILQGNHNLYRGLYKLAEQRKALAGENEADLSPLYEHDMWQSPVENASLELTDAVSLHLEDGTFPVRFFTLLRIMLTVRQNTPWIKDLYEMEFPGINSEDMFFCRGKDVYPLIVDTLRRELFFPLSWEA